MQYTDLTCREFVEILSTKAPVPGGGGACALVGALGCALGNMVGSLTVGKKKYADVEEEMQALKARADVLQRELLELVEMDAEAFAPLSKAYGLPHATQEEAEEKERILQQALFTACGVPLQIMEKVLQALELVEVFAQKGSVIALSDAGVAAAFCRAALSGAQLNVKINTRMMKDRARAEALDQQAESYLEEGLPRADAILSQVQEKLA